MMDELRAKGSLAEGVPLPGGGRLRVMRVFERNLCPNLPDPGHAGCYRLSYKTAEWSHE